MYYGYLFWTCPAHLRVFPALSNPLQVRKALLINWTQFPKRILERELSVMLTLPFNWAGKKYQCVTESTSGPFLANNVLKLHAPTTEDLFKILKHFFFGTWPSFMTFITLSWHPAGDGGGAEQDPQWTGTQGDGSQVQRINQPHETAGEKTQTHHQQVTVRRITVSLCAVKAQILHFYRIIKIKNMEILYPSEFNRLFFNNLLPRLVFVNSLFWLAALKRQYEWVGLNCSLIKRGGA